jgi:hypothetical protein
MGLTQGSLVGSPAVKAYLRLAAGKCLPKNIHTPLRAKLSPFQAALLRLPVVDDNSLQG